MRVGLIVDGRSEVNALPILRPQLERGTGHTFIGPILADIQPKAPAAIIARESAEVIVAMRARRLDLAIVLFDREDNSDCPGELAEQVSKALQAKSLIPVCVIVKESKFENWLVSDPQAIQALPARFALSNAVVNAISPNKADHVDAERILRDSAIGRTYNKVLDARRILQHADMLRMAANSRSFRRFLRCIEHPTYSAQSRNPA